MRILPGNLLSNITSTAIFFKPNNSIKKIISASAIFLLLVSSITGQNAIVTENNLPGNPSSEWDITGAGDLTIQGFATDISVNKGETINFKIKTDARNYTINIYRLGYYQGKGARKVGTGVITATLPQIQPLDLYDESTGKTDCSNWGESAKWVVPSTAVSGIYIAKLIRNDNGGSSHIIFIVRDDNGNSDLLFKTSDATWQAYNVYGGNSLYVKGALPPLDFHANKVSYNRPFYSRAGGGGGDPTKNWVFNAEYPMIRWLERNGYNVSYTTCVDMNRSVIPITPVNHKVLLSVGHDEYWSTADRSKFENARNAGVHLAFFSGNEIYWKVRYEDNFRTLVCYKEGTKEGPEIRSLCGSKCDPVANVWTGLWNNGCDFPIADGCNLANGLTGTGHMNVSVSTAAIEVPDAYKKLRFWRNTSIASLGVGEIATLAQRTLGYEWDYDEYSNSNPPGRIFLSSKTVSGRTHQLSLYRRNGGALVFGAGTVQWSWGLDDVHDDGASTQDIRMQQATVNLLADMNSQPGTLQSGLTLASTSTDNQRPSSVITTPANGENTIVDRAITISGTASDVAGVVAGVEVSVDGGITWQLASGTTNWSFSWIPNAEGTVTIKTRSFDDIGNIEIVGNTAPSTNLVTIEVKPKICPCNVFQTLDKPEFPLSNDGQSVELGFKFRTTQNGNITGIRFYKGNGASGTHSGHLWSMDGTLLGEAIFINESASGWQEALFLTPVAVTAGTTYIASTFSTSGDYAKTNPFFTKPYGFAPVIALADGEDGHNGVGIFSPSPAFPTGFFETSNYWIDVVFNTNNPLISKNPVSLDVCPGTNVSFFSSAGSLLPLSVQWQQSLDGTIWSNIAGATSKLLTFVAAVGDNGKQYRATWTNLNGSVNSGKAILTVSPQIVASVNKLNATCKGNDGTITVIATGGIAPYQYILNSGASQTNSTFSGLVPGTYMVMVKDAKGCTTSISGLIISQDISLIATLTSKTNASCFANDGAITIAASGGTVPYLYTLDGVNFQTSGTFNNLAAGTYNVTVKDSRGCTSTISSVISKGSTLAVAVSSKTSPACGDDNGSVTLSASGGVAPYTYSRDGSNYQTSNIFSSLYPYVYNFSVKDSKGCISSVSVVLTSQNTSLSAVLFKTISASCKGNDGSISVVASGGTSPYWYTVNGNNYQTTSTFANLVSDTFNVGVVDSRYCVAIVAGVVVTRDLPLTIAVSSKSDANCVTNDGSITVTSNGGSGPYLYTKDGVNYQTANKFSNLAAGTYNITVKDTRGCTSTISAVTVASISTVTVSVSSKTDATCTTNDGSIEVVASAGTGPYTYSLNGGSYQSNSTFNNLLAGIYNISAKDNKGCTASLSVTITSKPSAVVSSLVSKVDATCTSNDGSLTVTASGGASPYLYNLNGGAYNSNSTFSNLVAGTYNITAKDAKGCSSTLSVTINSKTSNLSASLQSKTNPNCNSNDGSITISVTGGTTSYQYSLNGVNFQVSNTFNNLSSGTYNITVKDAKGCITAVSGISISATSTLAASISSEKDITCGGNGRDGSITILASGGNTPYSYSLNGGSYQSGSTFSSLSTGTYSITVKDSKGCTKVISGITLTINSPNASLTSTTKVSCKNNDGSFTIAVTGGSPPYQYNVNSGGYKTYNDLIFENLLAGTYNISVRDSKGCTDAITGIVISKAPTLLVSVSTKSNASCSNNDGSITVLGSGGIAPYQYSLNGTTYQTGSTFTRLSGGTYQVTIKDTKGCTSTVSGITITRPSNCRTDESALFVDVTSASESNSPFFEAKVTPNPSASSFTLVINANEKMNERDDVEIIVMDMMGRILYKTNGPVNRSYNFGKEFSNGIYVVKVLQGANKKNINIVKQ